MHWPGEWRPIEDEASDVDFQQEWQYWRHGFPDVAPTVVEELHREGLPRLLKGRQCHLLAWYAGSGKDYLLETDHPTIPVVMVHLTWYAGSTPFLWPYKSVASFIEHWEQSTRKHVQSLMLRAVEKAVPNLKEYVRPDQATQLTQYLEEVKTLIEKEPEQAFLSLCALPVDWNLQVPKDFYQTLSFVGRFLDWEKKRHGTPWEQMRERVLP